MTGPCKRCDGTQKLRSGAWCPACTHSIEYRPQPFRRPGNHIAGLHVVTCSCGWRHTETSRQNALGRATKMRAAVRRHLQEAEGKP